MRARGKRLPGQPGTKALMKIYGEQLVCVRYRYDASARKRYKTVELIIDEAPWEPPRARRAPDTVVHLRIAWDEVELQRRVKAAGGRWLAQPKRWALRYDVAERLSLLDRIDDNAP
jgi:hypothetical protein